MFHENVQRATIPKSVLLSSTKRECVPKAQSQRPRIVVNQIGVAKNANDWTRPQKSLVDPPELVAIPNVILICQGDDCTLAERNRFLKVLGRAEVSVIDYNPGGKGRAPSELLYDFN